MIFLRTLIFMILFFNLQAQELKLEKVKLQLQWKHQFEFAGFYAAKEKGFYKDVGLDVELIELQNNTNIVNEVISSRVEYGVGYSSILVDYFNSKPIVLVSNFFKQSPLVLIAQKNIRSLAQLKNARIEWLSNDASNITLYAMMNKLGVEKDDIKIVPPSFDIENFSNKKVDALVGYITNEPFNLQENKIEYNIFDPASYGIRFYDVNLFTSQTESINNPQRVKNFQEASVKGWKYALENKEEIVNIILEKYNTQNKSKKSLMYEAIQVESIMLPQVHEIGSVDMEMLKTIYESFVQSSFIDKSKIDGRTLEKFVFEYNQQRLSEKEKKYLKEKKVIRICVDPNWMPIEAVVDDKYIGIGADYLDYFVKKLGKDIEVYKTTNWQDSLRASKLKECDILSLSQETEDRKSYMNFTDPILSLSLVIVSDKDKKSLIDPKLFSGKTIAVVKDYAMLNMLRERYPYINLVEVENIKEGLQKVQDDEVYGYADTAVAIDYLLSNDKDSNFKINAYFNDELDLGYAIQKSEKDLFSIFQKLIKEISPQEKKEIMKKWFLTPLEQKIDYELLYKSIIALIILIIFWLYWFYSLKKINQKLTQDMLVELKNSREKDKIIFHQSKLASMGEMIENIAHQWRQPLSQVNSAVLIIDDILDEKKIKDKMLEDKLLEIEQLTKFMSNTIDDFKNFFDKNKKKEIFDLVSLLGESIKLVKNNKKSRIIEFKIKSNNSCRCNGYKSELQQVLISILNNAVDALVENKTQKPLVVLELIMQKQNCTITINDNAGGINEEYLDKIFEPYFTTKHKARGTGLGLYIAKMIVEESLGGLLSVQNKDSGASFKIELEIIGEK